MLKIFKRMNRKEVMMAVVSVLFIMAQVWLDLKVPDYMSEVTKKLVTPGTELKELYQPGGMMLLLSLLSFATSLLVGFLAARLGASFTRSLRRDVFEHVLSFSAKETQSFSVPSLITRTTNDIIQLQMLIAIGLQVMVKGPIMAGWAMVKISNKNGQWMLATALAVLLLLIVITIIMVLAFPKQKMIQKLTDKLNAISRENLTGIRVIRAYNAEKFRNEKFDVANSELTDTNLFSMRIFSLMMPLMTIVSSGLSLSVYWIGAYLIQNAALNMKITLFGDMAVFTSYAMQVVMGFMMMTMIFVMLPRAIVSAKRINEVLETHSVIDYPATTKTNNQANEYVLEYENVTFKYSDSAEPVISNVSFKAKKGQTIAFIGSTGSGKSTLINLLPRFYDVTSGAIKLNGQNIKEIAHDDLNNRVGYIPQKAVIFSGTIASNLNFGESNESPLTEEKMNAALELAQAKEFVLSKENGLQSTVAQEGANFSGGQKQRLAIARALARKPEILIFDDSFSALDYKTDKALRHDLAVQTADMTKLIVAQRISTIMDADLILVLDQGEVVGQGTHQELLANNEVYQEIAYSQLSKEELTNG
ncbi:ABC transporter ATP-binding protein [Globicatella sanguinis]|uniref:ABC transporter ATP-binding protein n=1 Tax=Globicatella sanguinis TaxID=13076 RepID=UPI000C7A5036|nr:ABC transporter ATP-binding protein [Globicatella sanguinis]MDK7630684.1 ABC transporter ATP-binding protein [Globicatella sanguinis]WIK66006.1 ABC transporter ATP-binding protein [Globicatella sanguinis]WKT55411.1 ABC transporter ATP-binding protein [Globicatella sanguinis]